MIIVTASEGTALEAAIAADPYDPTPYVVYADWLQGRGDPRGELIALSLARDALRVDDLLRTHAATFLGPLADRRDAFTWRYGFIHAAVLTSDDARLADALAQLLGHPSGRFLAELTIGRNGAADAGLEDVLDVLAAHAPPSLRVLRLEPAPADFVVGAPDLGSLAALWPALPGLTSLEVHAGAFDLGEIALPALTRAEIWCTGLTTTNMRAIAAAEWPRLATLALSFGTPRLGCTATHAHARELLARTDLTALRELTLAAMPFSDELCKTLPGLPVIARLVRLALVHGTLTDTGAFRLAAGAARLRHLDTLDITSNFIGSRGVDALARCVRLVGEQLQGDASQIDDYFGP